MALYRRATSVIRRRGAPTMLPARAMASLLGHVEPAPKDPIFGVTFPLSPPLPFPAPATDRSAKKPTTYP
ncbi:aspartate aminotransferase, mitochondrial-like [Hordeum vulgare]|nr:aspartate aminotransferase, mitochondrial-like [Hordeum vulgare]